MAGGDGDADRAFAFAQAFSDLAQHVGLPFLRAGVVRERPSRHALPTSTPWKSPLDEAQRVVAVGT